MQENREAKFNADELPPEEILALKELERRNRDAGAVGRKTSDWMRDRGPFQLRAESRIYTRTLAPRMGDTVLDAGAGMGRFAVVVAPLVKRLVAVDLSGAALEVLQAEAKARNISNLETAQGDLCSISPALGPFDSVYSIEAVQHIPSYKERLTAVRNLRRVLKPGGKCMISVIAWNRRIERTQPDMLKEGFWGAGDQRLYAFCSTPADMRSLMEAAGFRDVRIRGVIVIPGRISRRLPPQLAFLESWCSSIPQLAQLSWFVMGIGVR